MMRLFLTYSLLFLGWITVIGQSSVPEFNPRDYVESVSLVTDRDYYVVDEVVKFRAFNTSPEQLRDLEWSKVLYVELISSEGKSLAQSKVEYSRNGGHGQLLVPEGILSGTYYIKAYTKWMRNFGPKYYFYKPICLLNPNKSSVYLPEEARKSEFLISYSSMSDINKGRVQTDKSKYSFRSKGEIVLPNGIDHQNESSYSISRTDFINDTIINLSPLDTSFSFNNKYLPETRGVTLTGVLLQKSSQKPIPNRIVRVTIKKGKRITFTSTTNSSGNFNIVLPETYGKAELLILAEESLGEELEIKLESDFCAKKVSLPYIPLKTGKHARDCYNELVVDSQIEALYHPKSIQTDSSELSEMFLYENPSLSFEVDQFIAMKSIRELFKELVPAVGFRKENNKTIMHISGPYYYGLDTYKPLVLLDGVIIQDIDKLLLINPGDLKSVETLNVPYVIGDITYGGVVKMESKEGNLAAFELPSSGLIYNYDLLNEFRIKDESPSEHSSRDAMFSNTLFWNSGISDLEKQPKHSFFTGDNAGEYSLVVYEMMDNGELELYRYNFIIE